MLLFSNGYNIVGPSTNYNTITPGTYLNYPGFQFSKPTILSSVIENNSNGMPTIETIVMPTIVMPTPTMPTPMPTPTMPMPNLTPMSNTTPIPNSTPNTIPIPTPMPIPNSTPIPIINPSVSISFTNSIQIQSGSITKDNISPLLFSNLADGNFGIKPNASTYKNQIPTSAYSYMIQW
jgi:hypothetical protein